MQIKEHMLFDPLQTLQSTIYTGETKLEFQVT